MEKPRNDTPVRDLLDHGAQTIAGVAADPETKDLEKPFKAANLDLKLGVRALEDKEEEELAKEAVFLVKDKALDREINEFEARLLVLVGKKRDAPQYRRYFKNGLREVTQAEPRAAEPALVEAMIQALAEDEAKPGIGPLAVEMGPRLKASLKSVRDAEKELAAVETEGDYLRDKTILELRAAWVTEYVKLHSAVVAVFPSDPARAESSFRPFRRERKKASAGGGVPQEAPAGTPGATYPHDGSAPLPPA